MVPGQKRKRPFLQSKLRLQPQSLADASPHCHHSAEVSAAFTLSAAEHWLPTGLPRGVKACGKVTAVNLRWYLTKWRRNNTVSFLWGNRRGYILKHLSYQSKLKPECWFPKTVVKSVLAGGLVIKHLCCKKLDTHTCVYLLQVFSLQVPRMKSLVTYGHLTGPVQAGQGRLNYHWLSLLTMDSQLRRMLVLLSQRAFEPCSVQVVKKKKMAHFWLNTKHIIWRQGAEVEHCKKIRNSQYEISCNISACYIVLFE